MRTFNEFQNDKEVERLRNGILELASRLPVEHVVAMDNIFEGPFQPNTAIGNIGNNLKAAWNAYQGQRAVNNTDNPVANGYTQLAQSLDGFIKTVNQHPVGKQQGDLINMLGKFKQNLSVQGSELASQMKQYNAQNSVNKIQSQSGQPMQNSTQSQPAGSLDPEAVIQHLKQQGFNPREIAAYQKRIQQNQVASTPAT